MLLCIWLTVFFIGCKTTGARPDIPLPAAPVLEPVRFEDRDGGLWLSYPDYRALERNVIAMREYIALLEIVTLYAQEK
jgi:hypothetical protein